MATEPLSKESPAAPVRRKLSSNLIRMLTINVIFGLLVGVGVYAASEKTTMLLRWAGFAGAAGLAGAGEGITQADDKGLTTMRKVKLVGAASLDPNDPVLRFAETRIGQLVFASAGRDNCDRLLFDNRNGSYYDTPQVFCGQRPEQAVESETPARLMAVRKSLGR
jgi:hypothetical protein